MSTLLPLPRNLRQAALEGATASEARRLFQELESFRPGRVEHFGEYLTQRCGLNIDDPREPDLIGLCTWFHSAVVVRLDAGMAKFDDTSSHPLLSDETVDIIEEIGFYLKCLLVLRNPHLEFALQTGSTKNVLFQHCVVRGFRRAVKSFSVDFTDRMYTLASVILAARGLRDDAQTYVVRGHLIDLAEMPAKVERSPMLHRDTLAVWFEHAQTVA